MMLFDRISVEVDWEVWAIHRGIAHGWGQTIIRVGPICIWWIIRGFAG